jgi:hypothetical protein
VNVSQDQVRAATRNAAAVITPDSVPPFRPQEAATGSVRPSRPRRGWVAPLSTVAAVAVVVAGCVLVGSRITSSHQVIKPHGSTQKTTINPDTVPPYYVAITDSSQATVRATATGATLARITLSAPIVGVTGAADDRTFILDAQRSIMGGAVTWVGQPAFYLLKLTASGAEKSLTKVSFPALPSGVAVSALALSPDGSKLAVESVRDGANLADGQMEMTVATLATGANHTWSADDSSDPGDPGFTGSGTGDSATISWAADSATLAFDWESSYREIGVRLLNTAASGEGLIADSRLAVVEPDTLNILQKLGASHYKTVYITVHGHKYSRRELVGSPFTPPYYVSECETPAMITEDGSSIVCGYSSDAGDGVTAAGFILYSSATGKQEGAIGFQLYKTQISGQIRLYWTNATGTLLVGAEPTATGDTLGVINGEKFTPLAGDPSFADAAW